MKNQFYFPIGNTQSSLSMAPRRFDQKCAQSLVSLKATLLAQMVFVLNCADREALVSFLASLQL